METKISKNAILARSGVYEYSRRELKGLHLDPIPRAYDGIDVFRVYRPAAVLMANHQKFRKLTVQREHNAWITPENYRELAIGWTGDSSEMEYDAAKDEVLIKSTVELRDAEGLIAYDSGITEVSPGYDGHWIWKEGNYNGEQYQIVMDSIREVNHLALTVQGRGGRDVRIFDSRCTMNEGLKKYLSGLWHSAKKKAMGAMDSEIGPFRAKVDSLVAGRGTIDEAGVKTAIDELKGLMADLPESEEKGTLARVLDDFGVGLKEQDDATAKQAGSMLSDLFEKQEGDAMDDVIAKNDPYEKLAKDEADKKASPPAKDGAPAPKEEGKGEEGGAGSPGGSGTDPTTPKTPTDKKPEDGAPVVEPDGDEPLTGEEVKKLRAILAQAAPAGAADGDAGKAGDGKSAGEVDKKPDDAGKAADSAGEFRTSIATKESAQELDAFLDKHTFGRK